MTEETTLDDIRTIIEDTTPDNVTVKVVDSLKPPDSQPDTYTCYDISTDETAMLNSKRTYESLEPVPNSSDVLVVTHWKDEQYIAFLLGNQVNETLDPT